MARGMRPQRARTSKTHPLIFDAIKIGEGVVGMTICPGKKGASIYGAPWDRSLELDGQQIAAWKATSLVTLMREPEFPELGLSSSSSIGSAAFIDRHYQVPVHDLRAPCYDPFDENILMTWRETIEKTLNQLISGERIVVHCRGGLGRTGTFVAELLIHFGLSPKAAIKRVRASRSGAIETQEQMTYLLNAPYKIDTSKV